MIHINNISHKSQQWCNLALVRQYGTSNLNLEFIRPTVQAYILEVIYISEGLAFNQGGQSYFYV